jgi:hypothetical protein
VRYKSQAEAQVTQGGWDLATSQQLHNSTSLNEQQAFLSAEHPLNSGFAPSHVSLRIVESPAEFAVPVKQDRCGIAARAAARPCPPVALRPCPGGPARATGRVAR